MAPPFGNGMPIGSAIPRIGRIANALLYIAAIITTIPSIALPGIMLPVPQRTHAAPDPARRQQSEARSAGTRRPGHSAGAAFRSSGPEARS